MDFEIKLINNADLPGLKAKAKPKSDRVEEGIEYSKWMWYPTCPFCGLKDAGEEAGERPTEIHMLSCRKRPIAALPLEQRQVGYKDGKPVFEKHPIEGTFVGQAFQAQVRYPMRQVLRLPKRNPITKAVIPGEFIFVCKYYWKVVIATHQIWTSKGKWVPWFEIEKQVRILVPKVEPTESEANWLKMFMRNP